MLRESFGVQCREQPEQGRGRARNFLSTEETGPAKVRCYFPRLGVIGPCGGRSMVARYMCGLADLERCASKQVPGGVRSSVFSPEFCFFSILKASEQREPLVYIYSMSTPGFTVRVVGQVVVECTL